MTPRASPPLDVLVVDDDVPVAQLVRTILERDGLAVDVANDGPEALASLCARSYRVVLTDYTMPGMSGLELVREAEQSGLRAGFLLMTAFLDSEAQETVCREPGVAGVVIKPFDVGTLLRDVRTVWQARLRAEVDGTGTVGQAGDVRVVEAPGSEEGLDAAGGSSC